MSARIILLSDIHANLSALDAVLADIESRYRDIDGAILLGDIVNYGMRPNEVIERLRHLPWPLIAAIRGNHEQALADKITTRFSTDRGRAVLEYTRARLSADSLKYLAENVSPTGMLPIELAGKKLLLVHATLEDHFWGKFTMSQISEEYASYDYVLMGHSHKRLLHEEFFKADRPDYRDKKRTIFINPGSVGQPRNHNPRAQYAYLDIDSETFHFNSVGYDIASEQALYNGEVDEFYKQRLNNGI